MALGPGFRLDAYEIVRPLGAGGMGEVWLATEVRLGRKVALKVLPPDLTQDPLRIQRFEQEAQAASALNHPNVCTIHALGQTTEGEHYIAMEYVEGETLRQRLATSRLTIREALDLAIQVAAALSAAHTSGIIHRDIKPENVMLRPDGLVKVLDFGLAKLAAPPSDIAGADTTRTALKTEAGLVVGTAAYMSPEQVRAQAVDHRSDIFSFGTVLYEMLSGVRAFQCASAAETMNAILKEDPTERPGVGEAIPPTLARIVRRCLEKRAVDRFQSAHDLAFALKAASARTSGEATREQAASHAAFRVGLTGRRKWVVAGTVAAMVLSFAGVYRSMVRSPLSTTAHAIDSIAVLPFENVGGDPDRQYLSDGVAETLINKLSRLPDLKVMARSTSFRFRGKDVDPRQVGRDLNVGAVLTGRVSLRGDALIVGAELVDVVQGTQLWGDHYTTRMEKIFTVEEDIAGEIWRGLRLKLPRSDTNPLTRRATEDSEAYRLFLRSRYEINYGRPDGFNRAVEYAQQATARDPTFAAAYAALARAYRGLGIYGLLSNREANTRVRAAALKALDIDESLAEAHTALADARWLLEWDWAAADHQFKRAIEINPNSADAHDDYSIYLAAMGRFEEGLVHGKRAVELDPLTPARRWCIGIVYYFARQFDEALGTYNSALEFDRNLDFHAYLGWNYREKGMYEQAIAELRKGMEKNPSSPHILGHLGNAYARAGRAREARVCLRKLEDPSRDENVGTYEVAFIHAALGEKDQAFEWLEKAYEERNQGLAFLKVAPELEPLRSDPRFQRILRRMNFPS